MIIPVSICRLLFVGSKLLFYFLKIRLDFSFAIKFMTYRHTKLRTLTDAETTSARIRTCFTSFEQVAQHPNMLYNIRTCFTTSEHVVKHPNMLYNIRTCCITSEHGVQLNDVPTACIQVLNIKWIFAQPDGLVVRRPPTNRPIMDSYPTRTFYVYNLYSK